jgi:hypothetical protein
VSDRSLEVRLAEYSVIQRGAAASVQQIVGVATGQPGVDPAALRDLGVIAELLEKVSDDLDVLVAGGELPVVHGEWRLQ